MALLQFKDEEFQDENKLNGNVVVQFSASWCSPCQALKPIMEKLSNDYNDTTFLYGDIENDAINTGSAMGIRGVPCTIIFKKKTEVERLIGNPGEAKVKEFLDKNI